MWIDGCGGFLLLVGPRVRVGSGASPLHCDISIRADLARTAGMIEREDDDYFWQAGDSASQRSWIQSGSQVSSLGSARLVLRQPSPLTRTAVLELGSPHRFGEQVDAALLVDGTILIGPTPDCHVRLRRSERTITMVYRSGLWVLRSGTDEAWKHVSLNETLSIDAMSMMLESA